MLLDLLISSVPGIGKTNNKIHFFSDALGQKKEKQNRQT